jgi:hypothetical protein
VLQPIALCIGAVEVKLRMNKIIIKAIMKLAPNKSLERMITRLHALRAASSCPPLSARYWLYGQRNTIIHSSVVQQFTQRKEKISWMKKERAALTNTLPAAARRTENGGRTS